VNRLQIKRLLLINYILILLVIGLGVLNCKVWMMFIDTKQQLQEVNSKIDAFNAQQREFETERNTLLDELKSLRKKVEINDRLLNENDNLRSTIKKLSFNEGVSRSGIGLHRATPLENITLQQNLGIFRISYYTPSKEECGSNSGITSSGRPVVGAYTCAADTSIWSYGTLFYVEGFGLVEVMDTGGAIKGSNRLDICLVTNRSAALQMGVNYRNVWLVSKK